MWCHNNWFTFEGISALAPNPRGGAGDHGGSERASDHHRLWADRIRKNNSSSTIPLRSRICKVAPFSSFLVPRSWNMWQNNSFQRRNNWNHWTTTSSCCQHVKTSCHGDEFVQQYCFIPNKVSMVIGLFELLHLWHHQYRGGETQYVSVFLLGGYHSILVSEKF